MSQKVWVPAFLALGANLGECHHTLDLATSALASDPAIRVLAKSAWYLTSPVESAGPDYVNGVLKVETRLSASDLLALCLVIEKRFGRVRPQGVHNAPRTLDIDILLYGDECCTTPALTLPHPRMTERLFVLLPMSEVAPDWMTSEGKTIHEQIAQCRLEYPKDRVERIE